MKSMTGYGLAQGQSAISRIEVSLRSVNGRFLETRVHLPREFFAFEADLKKILSKYFERGTVDVFVSRKLKPDVAAGSVVVNEELASQYLNAFKKLGKKMKLKNAVSLDILVRQPEVIRLDESIDINSVEKKPLFTAFEKACEACEKERIREGQSLIKYLRDTLQLLTEQVEQMAALREEANANLQQRLESKIKSRLQGHEIDISRLAQEVVMQVERADINEELSRLKEHLTNYQSILQSEETKGKKLDFYTQELLREVNTIGSKSGISKLTQIVVEAKTHIERLREQVQNVE